MSEQLTCADCSRAFKLTRTLAQHRKSCAWVKQRQREAARDKQTEENEEEEEENRPSDFEAAHRIISTDRLESGNEVFPYPTVLDAVVGLVSSHLWGLLLGLQASIFLLGNC